MAKIAIVLNASWNVWNFRIPLLQALEQAGHEILVIAPDDEYVERIPFSCHHIDISARSTNPLLDIKTFMGYFQLFRRLRPDILLLYTVKPNVYGNFAAFLTGTKTISNIAGLGMVFTRGGAIKKLVSWFYRMALRVPEKVFFQNEDDMQLFLSKGLVSPDLAEAIPGSGVDLKRFLPKTVVSDKGGGPFVFLLFARMLWDKGVSEYVEAANMILAEGYDAEFKLLGPVSEDNLKSISHAEMATMTQPHGIDYIGVSDRIEDEIATVDCIVLPSYYREGTPKSLLEAAAMAKPIITTDTAGCRDVVDEGVNGFLCKVKDPTDLYDKMKRMLQLSDDQRMRMGKKGREKMKQRFDQQFVIEKYQRTVADILAGS